MKYDLNDLCLSNSPITYGVVQPGIEGDIKLIRSTDISDRYINVNQLRTISSEVSNKYKRTLIQGNELLISLVGNPGKISLSDMKTVGCNIARQVALVRVNPKLVDKMFLYYYLQIGYGKEQLVSRIMGSVQKVINLKDLKKVQIDVPSINSQKALANILSSLDDKIELNNKINKNLEELAQTLYKQWFVDFEFPNENGEPYKSSGGEMVESELGFIPKGWSVLTLDELVVKSSTKTNPDSNQKLIDMANMPSYSIALNSFDNGDKLSTNTYRMKMFSFLYGSIRPYLGKFGIAPFDGITTGTIHNFNVKDNFDYSLVATTVFSTKFNEFCIKLSHGTKMPTIKWDDFVSYKIIYSGEISYKFNKIVRVMFDRIVNNVLENLKLSKTRDELLPKLMNGEIEVPIEE